jgi:hypothetical protein
MPKRANPDIRWYPDHSVPVCKVVLDTFRDELIKECVDNPDGVNLPLDLGHFRLIGLRFKPRRSVVGIPLNNFNTNGVVYTMKWFSKTRATKIGAQDKPSFRESVWYTSHCLAKARRAVFDMVNRGEWVKFAIKEDRGDYQHGHHDYLKIRKYSKNKRKFSNDHKSSGGSA